MSRFYVNPYTGQVQDLDAVPVGPGGVKVCPVTGQPLNAAAVKQHSYAGPAADRAAWEADAMKTVEKIEAQATEPNAKTFGIHVPAAATE